MTSLPQTQEPTTEMEKEIYENLDVKTKARTALEMFITTVKEHHIKKNGDLGKKEADSSEFLKKCTNKWKILNEKQKEKFIIMAQKEKKICKANRKRMIDRNAPLKPMTAYFWFCEVERKKVKEFNPTWGAPELTKELARRWKLVEPELKATFDKIAAKDKERYEKEICNYKTNNGCTSIDHSKANDGGSNADLLSHVKEESSVYEEMSLDTFCSDSKEFQTTTYGQDSLSNEAEIDVKNEKDDMDLSTEEKKEDEIKWSQENLAKACRRTYIKSESLV